ncbi:low temperature requirement protein A [Novosphingobium sp.]|uniref:low temperature requirement protein A n=1 Tax=Novosphingobium sp. TaxID=1874826 RepID=UPI00286AB5B0|nr:low temperature requirement protein A [Novosphingobium sp.]
MAEPVEVSRPRPGIGAAIAAAEARQRRSLLRNHGGGHAPVTNLELFFDLVFVFAITQLSHYLLDELTPLGALRTAVLFGAVWWAWMWTTWATNWIDPDRAEVRLLLGSLMLLSLMMSAAIPHGFGDGALLFAASYVTLQIGRCLFVAWAQHREEAGSGLNMLRAAVWFCGAAPLWLGGALIGDPQLQLWLWLAALALEYTAPLVFMRVPGLGRSKLSDWIISGSHMSERCSLFIIIALGEGLVISGATYSAAAAQPWLDAALLTAFVGSFVMWWLYFDMGARRGAHHIQNHTVPGLIGRQAFTYWHIPIVAGIVVLAVADELVLAHPREPLHADMLAVIIGGTVLFIGGLAGFKRISSGNSWFPASHLYGLYALVPLALWGWFGHPYGLVFYGAIVALFGGIAVWEWGSFHGGWIERMERRDWRIGHAMRRTVDRRRARRLAREEAAQNR